MNDVVERGWLSFKEHCIPADAPAQQVADMRTVFFAGVTHLYREIMDCEDDGFDALTISVNDEINAYLLVNKLLERPQ